MPERYRVVGCSACDHLWIVDGQQDADATCCPRCEHRYERARRRPLAAAADLAVVREHRTRLLAERAADLDGTGVRAIALNEDRPDYGVLEDHLQERFDADTACDKAFAAARYDWTLETSPREPSPREQLVAQLGEERDRARAAATRTEAELLRDRRDDQDERASEPSEQVGEPGADEAPDYTLSTTQQPPVGVAAYVPSPAFGWNAIWRELLENGLEENLGDALTAIATGADSEVAVCERLLQAGVTALDGAYAGALARGVARNEQALWRARRLTRQLGGGQTTLGPKSAREDIVDGPLQLLAATDAEPTVAIGLPDDFRDAHRRRRSRFLQFVTALARVCDVRLYCSGLTATWLVREHGDQAPPDSRDLPLGVSEGVQAIVAALLQADAPLSQRGLARRAGISPSTVRSHREVLEGLGLLAVDEGANSHKYRLQLPFRAERRADDAPQPRYAPGPSQPFDILDANPSDARYRRSFLRPDMSKAARCLRPTAAVFDYLTEVGVAIDWEYGALWTRLVDEDLRLQDVVPVEHEAAAEVLRRLVGAADIAAFPLPGPLGLQTHLGRRPDATQCSLEGAASPIPAD